MIPHMEPDWKLVTWMRNIRRHLHQYPELAFEEKGTSDYIAQRLDELSIPYRSGVSETGIVATFGSGGPDSPCVALRADMDALPMEEKTGLPFASEHSGVMHACGHDGHVAMLLGAAALLRKVSPPGKIVLIFQPAEERRGGARAMIEGGALDGVDLIFGGHIDRHFPVGSIAVQPGLISAYTDTFHITITGRGGHAAKPHEAVDSIVVASLLVMSLQTLVSREINPSYPTVVTVGRIQGGTAHNVIAETAFLEGTIRATHPDIREKIINGLERMVKSMGLLYNAKTEIRLFEGYPPVVNDPAASIIAEDAVLELIGQEGLARQAHPSLGGEDFSYYLQRVPGCFARFGALKEDIPHVPAHSPYFDFDEGVLPVGAAFLARVAVSALERIEEIHSKGKR